MSTVPTPANQPKLSNQPQLKMRISQFFGMWYVLDGPLGTSVDSIVERSLAIASAGWDDDDGDDPYGSNPFVEDIGDGMKSVQLIGALTKYGGWGCTSTSMAADTFDQLRQDSSVERVLVYMDSPGGTVAGTKRCADALAALAAEKPCYGQIQDMGCSAMYWIGSQCTKLFANDTALVGSIGTYMAVADYSEYFEKLGIKVYTPKAGTFKAAGAMGTQVTPEQLAEWQTLIDGMNDHFIRGVAKGRGMPLKSAKDVADGRAHLASTALALNLLDGVQTIDMTVDALAAARRKSKATARASYDSQTKSLAVTRYDPATKTWQPYQGSDPITVELVQGDPSQITSERSEETPEEETLMSTATAPNGQAAAGAIDTRPVAATLDEIEQNCPGASTDFCVAQLRNKSTIEQAQKNYLVQLKADNDKLKADVATATTEITTLKTKVTALEGAGPGGLGQAKGLGTTHTNTDGTQQQSGEGAIERWNALVAKFVKQGMSKEKAIDAASQADEELHDAYIEAVQSERPKTRRR